MNQFRARAFTAVSFLPYNSEYWVGLNARLPITEFYYNRPYVNIGLGVGGCVGGESCNLTIYSGGLGLEFIFWSISPFFEVQKSGILQQRIRRTIWGEENSFLFGIRYYR